MLKCEDVIGMFDKYVNLDEIDSDFIKHIEQCPDCKKHFEIYKTYFSNTNIENDFAYPSDLDAKIKFKLNDIKKEKKFFFKPKVVLAYATSISFLFLIGIFGSTYIENLKKAGDIIQMPQVETGKTIIGQVPDKEKGSLTAPIPSQSPNPQQKPSALKKPVQKNEKSDPNKANIEQIIIPENNTTNLIENLNIDQFTKPNTEANPTQTPSIQNDSTINEDATLPNATVVPSEPPIDRKAILADSQEKSGGLAQSKKADDSATFRASVAMVNPEEKVVNAEISANYKDEILKKYSYTEVSIDTFDIKTNIETLKKDFPAINIINDIFVENIVTIKFVTK